MRSNRGRGSDLRHSGDRLLAILAALLGVAALTAAGPAAIPKAKPSQAAPEAAAILPPATDLKGAVPAGSLSNLPSTAEQVRQLNAIIAKEKPLVADAQKQSEALSAQTKSLKQQLIDTAQRITALESDSIRFDADIVRLTAQDHELTASFNRDRVRVSRLLALLERLQHDSPPALALRPDDALGAVRGAMLVGATLPDVYQEAADLARRITAIKETRESLVTSRAEAERTAQELTVARAEMDQLLARKEVEAAAAADHYSALAAQLASAANQASDLQALLSKVAEIRGASDTDTMTVVSAAPKTRQGTQFKGTLLRPVAGTVLPPVPGTRDPGLTFGTPPGAQVSAPADGKVLFAGPYHKSGQVLILEMPGGYDLVLAGLGQLEVRPDDEVLKGEPVGIMPQSGNDLRLYFVMRQNGQEVSPAPWLEVEMRKAK